MNHPDIVESILQTQPRPQRWRVLWGILIAVGLHMLLLVGVWRTGPSLETWGADLAVAVHQELARVEVVEVAEEPPSEPAEPEPPPPEPEPPAPDVTKGDSPAEPERPPAEPPQRARQAEPSKTPTRPPAQAGKVIAVEDSAPVDLSGDVVVTGEGTTYAGGKTSRKGTSTEAASGPVDVHAEQASPSPPPRPERTPDRSRSPRPVRGDWQCSWPPAADSLQINEESAVVRVRVDARGRPKNVQVVRDPGHGFGSAAAECAGRARFRPGLDREGRPTSAYTPPIRVHFRR